jgi:hypothetical protein
MNRISIRGLEIHASHACNLSCPYCSHFSNYKPGGNVPVELADAWMKAWNRRLKPRRFTIIGGEPCLNPDLCRFVEIARANWPDSKLHVVTNGTLLDRHPDLPRALQAAAPARLVMSQHHESPGYQEKYQQAVELMTRWRKEWGVEIQIVPSVASWRMLYRGQGEHIRPYDDGSPERSFACCRMKNQCRNLFEFQLYKCCVLTYLKLLSRTVRLDDQWRRYVAYQPLNPSCTDEELRAWLDQGAIPECGMCPARYQYVKFPSPSQTSTDRPAMHPAPQIPVD